MKRVFLISSIIIFLLVLAFLGVVKLFGLHKALPAGNANLPAPVISGITVSEPAPDSVISSPLTIQGQVNGGGWSGFEGQVGHVDLIDDVTGTVLNSQPLTATTDWTVTPASFAATMLFTLPASGTGKLVFHNENASGDPAKDKTFQVPVRFK